MRLSITSARSLASSTVRSLERTAPRSHQPLLAARWKHDSTSSSASPPPATETLPARWLSEVKSRIGHCITFGMNETQLEEATGILESVAKDWRELVAGSEGYLTGAWRRGLYRQAVVWGDMDSHVNNVMYNKYAESARVLWALNYATHIDPQRQREWKQLWTSRGVGMILRSMKTDFKFPMTFPDHVTVYHKLSAEPTSETDSFVLDVLILSERHQRPAARCVEDIVVYDYQKAKKAPLRPFMVEAFRETWRLQERAKRVNGDRVRDLLRRVKELELGTWDRPGAVEDMGSGGSS